jgi:hypothetical protein
MIGHIRGFIMRAAAIRLDKESLMLIKCEPGPFIQSLQVKATLPG